MFSTAKMREMCEVAMEGGGSVLGVVRWLLLEAGHTGGGPGVDSSELIRVMWEAFDITLGQAQIVSQWVGFGSGRAVSDERLELELGRLVPRSEDLDVGVLDRGREAFHQPRVMTLIGDHQDLPLHFAREFSVHSYADHFGLLVLRSRAGATSDLSDLIEIEFRHVQGMRVAPDYRELFVTDSSATLDAGGAEVVAEMDEFVPLRLAPSFERVLLSDGTRWGFVICHSMRVYRFDPWAECGR